MPYIAGAGGFGRETYDAWLAGRHESADEVEFLDDNRAGEKIRGLRVSSPVGITEGDFVIGIASTPVRKRLAEDLEQRGLTPYTVTHPRSIVGPETTVGAGCVFLAQCHISSNVTVGNHVQVNYNATVGHDTILEDYVTVLPGANVSGSVSLEEGVTVGSGAVVLQGLRIGSGTFIGAGSVVTGDVPPNSVVKGIPGRW